MRYISITYSTPSKQQSTEDASNPNIERCTLSQLRSGHCQLLQDYKHRVLGEPSDICTNCGASPQDVRHMFACTTHPTDLSPVDLWRTRWDQFVHLAISTTETWTDLVVANNDRNYSVYQYKYHGLTCEVVLVA